MGHQTEGISSQYISYRDSASRFLLQIFHESVSPKLLSIPLEFFQIFAEIFKAHGAPPMSFTLLANGKYLTHLGSRVNIFSFKFTLRFHQFDTGPIICHQYQQFQRYRWQISLVNISANF
jgi:hypothetical protein